MWLPGPSLQPTQAVFPTSYSRPFQKVTKWENPMRLSSLFTQEGRLELSLVRVHLTPSQQWFCIPTQEYQSQLRCALSVNKCTMLVISGFRDSTETNINLRYADDTTLMAEEELKSLLIKVKKHILHSKHKDNGIQSHHFMENRWGNNGNRDKTMFLGSELTADGDCTRGHLFLGRKKSYDKSRQRIKKQTWLYQERSI